MFKEKLDIKKYGDWWLVLIFLVVRLIINLEPKIISISFVIIYAVFILMLFFKTPLFTTLLVFFLTIDTMVGTYFFTKGDLSNVIFYGTIIVNLIIIVLLVQNFKKNFKK